MQCVSEFAGPGGLQRLGRRCAAAPGNRSEYQADWLLLKGTARLSGWRSADLGGESRGGDQKRRNQNNSRHENLLRLAKYYYGSCSGVNFSQRKLPRRKTAGPGASALLSAGDKQEGPKGSGEAGKRDDFFPGDRFHGKPRFAPA